MLLPLRSATLRKLRRVSSQGYKDVLRSNGYILEINFELIADVVVDDGTVCNVILPYPS